MLKNICKKRSNYFFCIVILAISLSGTNCYLLKQGGYILRYNRESVPVDNLLKDNSTAPELKQFLLLVNDIRAYARDSIGLASNKNYTRYVKVEKKYLVDVVSACDQVSFKQYQWCYPFFGRAPYKGFFERTDAEYEAQKLSRKGNDINIDEVDAFSTLGFFSDPIYSYMSSYSIYGIASLIFHEQTHATIFLKNQIRFNEQAATFVGDQGAINFVRERYGEDSEQYKNIFLAKADYETYLESLRKLYKELKHIYDSTNLTKDDKLAEKEKIIQNYKQYISTNYENLFKTQRYRKIGNLKINNAFLSARMTYTMNLDLFDKIYKKNSCDLKETVNFLKKMKKTKSKDLEKTIEIELNK